MELIALAPINAGTLQPKSNYEGLVQAAENVVLHQYGLKQLWQYRPGARLQVCARTWYLVILEVMHYSIVTRYLSR
ncbi:MAG: hypothetical protein R8M11_08395 [Gallionella sp.]